MEQQANWRKYPVATDQYEQMMHMQKTIERYQRYAKDVPINNKAIEQNMQHFKYEAVNMTKKIELLEASKRKLLGEGLGSCSIEELQQTEEQLEQSLINIRARKNQLFKEQIDHLKEKERILAEENAMLCVKCRAQPPQELTNNGEIVNYNQSSPISDVETELFIGLPERGTTRHLPRS